MRLRRYGRLRLPLYALDLVLFRSLTRRLEELVRAMPSATGGYLGSAKGCSTSWWSSVNCCAVDDDNVRNWANLIPVLRRCGRGSLLHSSYFSAAYSYCGIRLPLTLNHIEAEAVQSSLVQSPMRIRFHSHAPCG